MKTIEQKIQEKKNAVTDKGFLLNEKTVVAFEREIIIEKLKDLENRVIMLENK